VWEEELFSQLMDLLQHKELTRDDDSWFCEIGADGGFAVKDGYCFLSKNFLPGPDWNMDLGCAVKNVWKSLAPSKIVIFSWQLLLQKLPTRANLSRRGVLQPPSDLLCAWCHSEVETEAHLFTTCSVAVEVWAAIYSWLGIITVVPGSLLLSFESFGFPFKCKKRAKGLIMIWQTAMWSLWKARNSYIFEGKKLKVYEIVDAIKHRSLDWLIAKKFAGVCISYEWAKFPLDCLLR
jgi:hypothetical protein